MGGMSDLDPFSAGFKINKNKKRERKTNVTTISAFRRAVMRMTRTKQTLAAALFAPARAWFGCLVPLSNVVCE